MSVVSSVETALPAARSYGSLVAREAFLRRRALTVLIVRVIPFLAAALSVFITAAVVYIAFLPAAPIGPEFPFVNFSWLNSPFTVMPIQMFNWISRRQPGFHVAAAATGIILLAMTLLMNGLAIYIRYRIRRGTK